VSRIDQALQRYLPDYSSRPLPVERPLPAPAPTQGPGTGPVDLDEWLDIRELLGLLFRRRWQILLVAVLTVLPVAIYTMLAERLYRSTAVVQIDPEPLQVLPYREINLPSITPVYELFMKSQEQILRGSPLMSRVSNVLSRSGDPKLAAEAAYVWGRFSIQRIENTQMFRLSYVAPDPDVAARSANSFADEYIKQHFETRQETREKARQLLQREMESMEQRAQASEKQLVDYAQKHDISTSDPKQGPVHEKLSTLDKALTDVQAEIIVARTRADSIRSATVSGFPEKFATPNITALVTRLPQLEQELATLLGTFGENWPAVIQKRSEIKLARDQLEREKAAALDAARDQAAVELSLAENKRRLIASSVAEQESLVHRQENASIQYNILRREVETTQKLYEGLLERLRQTSVSSGMEFQGFHVIEGAVPSSVPDSPRVMWNLMLASVLGLALGVCIAMARHFWDTSISTIEDVEQLTVLPVLGTLPLVQLRGSGRRWLGRGTAALGDGSDQRSDVSTRLAVSRAANEGVRNVCASLLLSRSGRPPRLLMVTSAISGEGKSTVVMELGRALAESGASTLLVECDLRRPKFGSAFGVGSEGGLSMYLSGNTSRPPMVHATGTVNLFVVSAGPVAPNPPTLLASDRMNAFLRDVTASYQFVILDAPPVFPIADARVLARMVEGVVIVVRAGRAPKSLVRRMRTLLDGDGATVLGAVLNGADSNQHSGYDGYYHYDLQS